MNCKFILKDEIEFLTSFYFSNRIFYLKANLSFDSTFPFALK